jgi:hypothetical protein
MVEELVKYYGVGLIIGSSMPLFRFFRFVIGECLGLY